MLVWGYEGKIKCSKVPQPNDYRPSANRGHTLSIAATAESELSRGRASIFHWPVHRICQAWLRWFESSSNLPSGINWKMSIGVGWVPALAFGQGWGMSCEWVWVFQPSNVFLSGILVPVLHAWCVWDENSCCRFWFEQATCWIKYQPIRPRVRLLRWPFNII